MSLKTIISGLITVKMCFLPSLAIAQTPHFSSELERSLISQSPEARIRLTIPFGAGANTKQTAPRLDFAVRNYSEPSIYDLNWTRSGRPVFGQNDSSEMRLGFTLEKDPKWMLNNQVLRFDTQDDQANIGTAGKIGLGVAAVVLVGVAVIAVTFASCDNDPGGCFDDE